MSGSFLFGIGLGEDVRPEQPQVHQASMRNAVVSPLRNSLRSDFAKFGNFICAPEEVNYGIGVHATIKALFKFTCQAIFNCCSVG